MKHYTVRITNQVVEDMEKLYTYIAVQLRAPENAMRQYDRIAEAILTLDRFPERFGCFHTEPEYSMGIRRMVVDNFFGLLCHRIGCCHGNECSVRSFRCSTEIEES